jgi:hypothetical protein
MTFAVEPVAISDTEIIMTATTATDTGTPPVQYYFTNVTDPNHNSGWLSSPAFVDTDLTPETTYTYNVKTRDSAAPVPNQTAASADASATTGQSPDSTPPEPNPMTFAVEPAAISDSQITMTATTATDVHGVEYFFTNVTDSNHNSGWQDSATFTDCSLAANTQYTYNVKARDKSLAHNTTAASNDASATTLADTSAPTPDPMTFAIEPYATGSSSIAMRATTAFDASGPVQYEFWRTTGTPSIVRAWSADANFMATGLTENTVYGYKVRARDALGNVTAFSSTLTAQTGKTIQTMIDEALADRDGEEPVTVTIAAGTYSESLVIDEPNVTLVSAAGKATTIIAPGTAGQQAIEIDGDNVTIDGFTVYQGTHAVDADNPKEHTIWVHANYSTIQNCTIIGATGNQACILIGDRHADHPTAAAIWGYNVTTGTTKGHTIQNNTFRYGTATAGSGEGWGIFAVQLTDDCLIKGNTFSGDANDMTTGWNTNEGGPGTAIIIHSATKGDGTHAVTIEDNTATYLKYSWLTFIAEYPYNDEFGAGYEQAEDSEVNDVLVTGNTVHNLGKDGIHTSGVGITFKGVKRSDAYGALKTGDLTIGAEVTVEDNTIYANEFGVLVDGPTSIDTGYGCVLTADNLLITNNAIYSNYTAGLYNGTIETNQDDGAVTVDAEHNWWGDATGPQQATTNPLGAGNAVGDSVDYEPFWTNALMTTDANAP